MSEENQKYHFIYKITNNINGKIYIGKHSTCDLDDGYMGSGAHLWNAIRKYGIENFTKEILEFYDTEEEVYKREKEIVTEEFVKREDTYNMVTGGIGWSSSDVTNINNKRWQDPEYQEYMHSYLINRWKDPEYRKYMSEKNKRPHPELSERNKRVWSSDKRKEIIAKIKATVNSEEYIKENSKRAKDYFSIEENRIAHSNIIKEKWKDPEYRKSQRLGSQNMSDKDKERRRLLRVITNYFINCKINFGHNKPWMTKYSSNFWSAYFTLKKLDRKLILNKLLRERKNNG